MSMSRGQLIISFCLLMLSAVIVFYGVAIMFDIPWWDEAVWSGSQRRRRLLVTSILFAIAIVMILVQKWEQRK